MHNLNPSVETLYVEFDATLRDDDNEYVPAKVEQFLSTVEHHIHAAEVSRRTPSNAILNTVATKDVAIVDIAELPNGEIVHNMVMQSVVGYVQADGQACLVTANNWTFRPQQYFLDRKNALRRLKNDLQS